MNIQILIQEKLQLEKLQQENGIFSLTLHGNDKIEILESVKYGKCRQWILQTLMG